jgi:hypothetical protein
VHLGRVVLGDLALPRMALLAVFGEVHAAFSGGGLRIASAA